jgi:hypothetical protein
VPDPGATQVRHQEVAELHARTDHGAAPPRRPAPRSLHGVERDIAASLAWAPRALAPRPGAAPGRTG